MSDLDTLMLTERTAVLSSHPREAQKWLLLETSVGLLKTGWLLNRGDR